MFRTEKEAMQDLFDVVSTHLLTQNARSTVDGGPYGCAYRGIYNRSCAVGCLIPDDKYEDAMEGDFGALIKRWPDAIRSKYLEWLVNEDGFLDNTTEMASLVRELQLLHDYTDVTAWAGELYRHANKYDLSTHHMHVLTGVIDV